MSEAALLSGLLIAIGLTGIVLPVLPGLLLVWAGIVLWAVSVHSGGGWAVLAVASILVLAGTALKYAVPGRRLKRSGVPLRTTLAGAALGIVGFFVVPVVGLVLGFVLGVYLVELSRLRSRSYAWRSTVVAVKAVALSMGIELLTGTAMTLTWLVGLVSVSAT